MDLCSLTAIFSDTDAFLGASVFSETLVFSGTRFFSELSFLIPLSSQIVFSKASTFLEMEVSSETSLSSSAVFSRMEDFSETGDFSVFFPSLLVPCSPSSPPPGPRDSAAPGFVSGEVGCPVPSWGLGDAAWPARVSTVPSLLCLLPLPDGGLCSLHHLLPLPLLAGYDSLDVLILILGGWGQQLRNLCFFHA